MFDSRNVNCPYCKKAKLRTIEYDGRVIAYICALGCGSKFHPSHYTDFKHGIINYLAKRHNPNYTAQLDSEDIFENMKKGEELDREGVAFFSNTYVIGTKKFDEN